MSDIEDEGHDRNGEQTANMSYMSCSEATQRSGHAFAISPIETTQRRIPPPIRTSSMQSDSSYYEMVDQHAADSPHGKSHRPRRRHASGTQHVKHRRTRSGCYTCRQRRIKCDETRPVCERCRKGKRECNYPGSTSSPTDTVPAANAQQSRTDSVSELSDQDFTTKVLVSSSTNPNDEPGPMPEDVEGAVVKSEYNFNTPIILRHDSLQPSKSVTPAAPTEQCAPSELRRESHQSFSSSSQEHLRWLALPKDVRVLLYYHRDKLTHHHYAFPYDRRGFLKTTFLEKAVNDDSQALLYAIVAFAAYYYTLARRDSPISSFLFYYNKSIVLLQQSLKTKTPDLVTLLTVLQLATIEECLGDWNNMLGHQKAAHRIIADFFTPQTILHDDDCRQALDWYMRFDLLNAMLAGARVNLDRSWFVAYQDHCERLLHHETSQANSKIEALVAKFRLLAVDLCALMSARYRKDDHEGSFRSHTQELARRFEDHKQQLRGVLEASPNLAPSSSELWKTVPQSSASATPRLTSDTENFSYNFILLDLMAIELLFKHHIEQRGPEELTNTAIGICALIDTIEPDTRQFSSALLSCRTGLCVGSYYLPQEREYVEWARNKFAAIERLGLIHPGSLRERYLKRWGLPAGDLWLADEQCTSPVLSALKDFIECRGKAPGAKADSPVCSMTGIFGGMQVEEQTARSAVTGGSTT